MRPDGPRFTAEDVEHVIVYLRDGEGAEEEACIVEDLRGRLVEARRALRALVTTIESCDLSVVDEILVCPFVQRAKEQL